MNGLDTMGSVTRPINGPAQGPVNKHASITQVRNGYILYSGTQTTVAYTFDELVKHLADTFATPVGMVPPAPIEGASTLGVSV